MHFEGWRITAWIVAMCALVRFLPAVNKGMSLQSAFLIEGLVTLLATEYLDLTVNLIVLYKTTCSCKSLRARVTIYLVWHLLLSTPPLSGDSFRLLWNQRPYAQCKCTFTFTDTWSVLYDRQSFTKFIVAPLSWAPFEPFSPISYFSWFERCVK